MPSFHATLVLLSLCCVALLVGFAYRAQRWAPWLMLAAAVGLLLLMAHGILNLLH